MLAQITAAFGKALRQIFKGFAAFIRVDFPALKRLARLRQLRISPEARLARSHASSTVNRSGWTSRVSFQFFAAASVPAWAFSICDPNCSSEVKPDAVCISD